MTFHILFRPDLHARLLLFYPLMNIHSPCSCRLFLGTKATLEADSYCLPVVCCCQYVSHVVYIGAGRQAGHFHVQLTGQTETHFFGRIHLHTVTGSGEGAGGGEGEDCTC